MRAILKKLVYYTDNIIWVVDFLATLRGRVPKSRFLQDAVDKGVSRIILDHMKAVTTPPLCYHWKSLSWFQC